MQRLPTASAPASRRAHADAGRHDVVVALPRDPARGQRERDGRRRRAGAGKRWATTRRKRGRWPRWSRWPRWATGR